ncbi:hypothetical protein MRX96_030984 [Rhipicephalus microplus]
MFYFRVAPWFLTSELVAGKCQNAQRWIVGTVLVVQCLQLLVVGVGETASRGNVHYQYNVARVFSERDIPPSNIFRDELVDGAGIFPIFPPMPCHGQVTVVQLPG